jgi:hypothetical protein
MQALSNVANGDKTVAFGDARLPWKFRWGKARFLSPLRKSVVTVTTIWVVMFCTHPPLPKLATLRCIVETLSGFLTTASFFYSSHTLIDD